MDNVAHKKLFITGGTGLIGSRIAEERLFRNDRLVLPTRNAASARRQFQISGDRSQIQFLQADITQPGDWQDELGGCDAVIHLAGAGIADRRWTTRYKRVLRESRIESIRNIVNAIGSLPLEQRPHVLINASAIGFYGESPEKGEGVMDEQSPGGPADDFLAQLGREWEEQALRAGDFGVRVALLRTGIVLDELGRGSALDQMSLPFKLFMGGRIGNGRQWMSWIHWRDAIGIVNRILEDASLAGPVNVVSSSPVRNVEFSRALGSALGRPSWLPVPRIALRIALGELGRYAVMSQRVVPAKALEAGYEFEFPQIADALRNLVKRNAASS